MGLPVDKSWKLTTRGEHPAEGVAVKLANGACAEVLNVFTNTNAIAISLEWILDGLAFTTDWMLDIGNDQYYSLTKVERVSFVKKI